MKFTKTFIETQSCIVKETFLCSWAARYVRLLYVRSVRIVEINTLELSVVVYTYHTKKLFARVVQSELRKKENVWNITQRKTTQLRPRNRRVYDNSPWDTKFLLRSNENTPVALCTEIFCFRYIILTCVGRLKRSCLCLLYLRHHPSSPSQDC